MNPPEPLLMDSLVRVTVDELNFRRRPGLDRRILGSVGRGETLVVSEYFSPYQADGYIWYRVLGLSPMLCELPCWIATGTPSTSYVARVAPQCPDDVTVRTVGKLNGADQLECFGTRTLELEGFIRCTTAECFQEFPGSYEPSWLAHPAQLGLLMDLDRTTGLTLRYPPQIAQEPSENAVVRITGHFDDPNAAQCVMSEVYPWARDQAAEPFSPAVAREFCRQQFVVERYEVLDPAATR